MKFHTFNSISVTIFQWKILFFSWVIDCWILIMKYLHCVNPCVHLRNFNKQHLILANLHQLCIIYWQLMCQIAIKSIYSSVFQPFCCRGTLHKREDHSRNPMHWSVSPATYARMKLRTGCLRTYFPNRALRAEPSWKRQNSQRWPI